MDAIGSLCVSLGSSTVQLHDSLGNRRERACSEAGFSRQNVDRACGYITEEQLCFACSVCKRTHCKGYS
jgi:hypothetical protein